MSLTERIATAVGGKTPSTAALVGAGRLRAAGFYAVANGWENGRHSRAWVIAHIRGSIPRRNAEGVQRARRALAYFEGLSGEAHD